MTNDLEHIRLHFGSIGLQLFEMRERLLKGEDIHVIAKGMYELTDHIIQILED